MMILLVLNVQKVCSSPIANKCTYSTALLGSVRAILGLHPTDNVEVASSSHPEYEVDVQHVHVRIHW